MLDKIIELDNNRNYVILDETSIDSIKYYFGLRLDEKEEPTNNYLFFEESIDGNDVYLNPIDDEKMKGVLLTAFSINYLDKVYDEVK